MNAIQRKDIDTLQAAVLRDLEFELARLGQEEWEVAVYREPAVWTVADTVRHLVQAEKSMVRLMEGIRRGHPGSPEGFDLAAFNQKGIALIEDRSPLALLGDLKKVRQGTIDFMDTLDLDDWKKEGRHGSGRIMTVRAICHLIGSHARGHLEDIRTALGRGGEES